MCEQASEEVLTRSAKKKKKEEVVSTKERGTSFQHPDCGRNRPRLSPSVQLWASLKGSPLTVKVLP